MARILDATCSIKRVWPSFADIRIDVLKEAKPDIQADARFLPFRDGTFDVIYCDPPHSIGSPRYSLKGTNRSLVEFRKRMMRFGFWKDKNEWFHFLMLINDEFSRALQPNGKLCFKVVDGESNGHEHIQKGQLMRFLTNFSEVRSEPRRGRSRRSNLTTWFVDFARN